MTINVKTAIGIVEDPGSLSDNDPDLFFFEHRLRGLINVQH